MNDVTYRFTHERFDRPSQVKVGNQLLSENVYSKTRDKHLVRTEFGNGGKIHYEYDDFKRIKSVRHDEETEPRYTYAFDAFGNTAKVRDHHLGREAWTEYDLIRRPIIHRETEGDQL